VTVADGTRPILPLGNKERRAEGPSVGDQHAANVQIGMRCSATAAHLMGTFRATAETVSLVRTSIVSALPPSDSARIVRGAYQVAAGYPGCAACGATSYFQC
jgi:hypothetical protein